jgi:osmotically-inducible protein OsmY
MRVRRILLALAFVSLTGCLSTPDPNEDARIEAEVKARLVAEKTANLTRLGVLSRQGTVYLSGAVESAEQRAHALALTNGVRGVRRVVSALEVRSMSE